MTLTINFDWLLGINWPQIIYAAIGAFMGAALAFLGALHKRHKDKLRAKDELIKSLQFNLERLIQMMGYFSNGGHPNFTLDTTGIVLWTALAADILPDEVRHDVNWQRYQLDHINNKLSVFFITNLQNQSFHGIERYKGLDLNRVWGISDHIQITAKELSQVITKLGKVR